jgi:DNA-binding HxlR family transcriptional regulator
MGAVTVEWVAYTSVLRLTNATHGGDSVFGRHPTSSSPDDIVELIGHRWLLDVLRSVAAGPRRHRDLLTIDGLGSPVYPKTLVATLRHMRSRGLITSETLREAPPIREYRATPLGMELLPILERLAKFIDDHPEVRTAGPESREDR